MTSWTGSYQHGRPYAICDRCDRRKRLDELRVEWTGLKVCPQCFDPRPVHLSAPRIDPSEGAAIPGARPDPNHEAADADLDFAYNDGTFFDALGIESYWSDGEEILWSDGDALWWSA